MPPVPEKWTEDSVKTYLAEAQAERRTRVTDSHPDRMAYLQAASVLAYFDPDWLRPFEAPARSPAREALGSDLVQLPGAREQHWTLRPKSRAEGLDLLETADRMWQARQANPTLSGGALQEALDSCFRQDGRLASASKIEELTAAVQALEWIGKRIKNLPLVPELRQRLGMERLVAPFEKLTDGFLGRATELKTLTEFAGVLDAGGKTARRAQLMMEGIGGVGKSTLIAQFVKQHIRSGLPFPFAYLDFDNPALVVEDLGSLVRGALQQIETQFPAAIGAAELRQLADEYSENIDSAELDSTAAEFALGGSDIEETHSVQHSLEARLARDMASYLRSTQRSLMFSPSIDARTLPFLLVLDTFEEVQRRGVQKAARLWRFLGSLQNEFEALRVVVSGRAEVTGLTLNSVKAEPLQIKEFDRDSALAFLKKGGIQDDGVATALYEQVGGNPLSLKLASKVASREGTGEGGIAGLKTRNYLVFTAKEAVIQGQLYQRILDHLPNDTLKNLAHPGLVVRRVTPPILLSVLSGPCEVDIPDLKRAEELFELMKQQVDLVTEEPDGSLRHRQDVRRVMLKLLQDKRPEQVSWIHRLAVEYYRTHLTTEPRAELLYHLLQSGADAAETDTFWDPDAAESLLSSLDEFPPAAQAYLARKTGADLSEEVRKAADLQSWERFAERKARDAIRYGDLESAWKFVRERSERSLGSPLFPVEAAILLRRKQYKEAAQIIEEGINSTEGAGVTDRLLELERLRGDLLKETGRNADAAQAYERCERLAASLDNAALQLQLYTQRMSLRVPPGASIELSAGEVQYLDDLVERLTDANLISVRGHIRGLFTLAGGSSRCLIEKGLRVFDLDAIADEPFKNALDGLPQEKTPEPGKELLDPQASPGGVREAIEGARQSKRLNEWMRNQLVADPDNRAFQLWLASLVEMAARPPVIAVPNMAYA
jgi:tetratricopeptide (TPR) repeat protein